MWVITKNWLKKKIIKKNVYFLGYLQKTSFLFFSFLISFQACLKTFFEGCAKFSGISIQQNSRNCYNLYCFGLFTQKKLYWILNKNLRFLFLVFLIRRIKIFSKGTADKVIVFFYSQDKVRFANFWRISIEWMKKLFFSGLCFFFRPEKLNEWHMNFSGKQKKKKHTKIR